MKFFVNWLGEFVDLPEDPEEIADLLTRAGVETKNIETRGAKIDNVIVSQITASSRHPNADRLTVCEVNDGSGTKRQIVCGATNYKVGDKVPLALPGAKLPNGTEIRKSKLRGVESEGMLCSAIELGLGQDASGLLILSPEAKIGGPIGDVFPSDTILDVEITPNRGDLLSHFGLAREIAALTGNNLKSTPREGKIDIRKTGVTISAIRECPFFSARRIDSVKVGPSPQWLRAKIESVGIRSINNIVDISNFVMLELGQPTHAFDADKLEGGINVRLARDGEKFLALDGKTYSLKPDNLVVADQERAVGIAGVMGGEETGVTESTKNILLEGAYFLPASVRRTARNLSLPSDASYRFERGVDPEMVLRASHRATDLIQEIANGTPAKEIHVAGKIPANPADVSLSYEKCNQVVGVAIKPRTVDEILEGFGLKKVSAAKIMKWKIPSYRRDLQRDVDLIEEVVRAYGADQIPGTDRSRFTPSSAADKLHDIETVLRSRLIAQGLFEIRTSKLISESAIAFDKNAIRMSNPLSEDQVALRPNLMSGLIEVLERNIRAGAERVAIFELGKIFLPRLNSAKPNPSRPGEDEQRSLGILLWGERQYDDETKPLDFFDLKGVIASIFPKREEEKLSEESIQFRPSAHPDLSLATSIRYQGREIGFAGRIHSRYAAQLDTNLPITVAEIALLPEETLAEKSTSLVDQRVEAKGVSARAILGTASFQEMSKFPAITRDIAMVVRDNLTHEEVINKIFEVNEPLLTKVAFFDQFVGEEAIQKFGTGKKSLAYRLTYRDRSRTLTTEEVSAVHAKIRERLQRDLGAELRE
jgi:phenylalanyl-tRNA synthetase beta chain